MTFASTVWGDTPRLAGVQPVNERRDTAAIAPARGSDGVIMQCAKAHLAPRDQRDVKRVRGKALATARRARQASASSVHIDRPTTQKRTLRVSSQMETQTR